MGARTVVHSFACDGGVRHAICRTCDRRMFNGHNDKCPICRAPRLGSSIAELGWRPPREPDVNVAPMFGPMMTSGGTVFFPVDPDDETIPIVEVRRVRIPGSTNSSEQESIMTSILQDIATDPVMQAAMEGLRNPGGISVSSFLSNVGEARRARNASTRATVDAAHQAEAFVEGRGD
jgi:hypothetical protein